MKLNLANTILDKIMTMKDGSLKITLSTRELPVDQMVALFSLINQEIPEIETDIDTESKSPSKRLKDRLWVYYSKINDGSDLGFRSWYETVLDQIGRKYLDKLPENE